MLQSRLRCRAPMSLRGRSRFRVWWRARTRVRAGPWHASWSDLLAVPWCNWRTELRAHGTVLSRLSIWVPWPTTSEGLAMVGSLDTHHAAISELGEHHGDVPFSMLRKPAPFLGPRAPVFLVRGLSFPWGQSLGRVRVVHGGAARPEATPVPPSPGRAKVRAHVGGHRRCRFPVSLSSRSRFRVWWKCRARVRARSRDAPGPDPLAVLWSTRGLR